MTRPIPGCLRRAAVRLIDAVCAPLDRALCRWSNETGDDQVNDDCTCDIFDIGPRCGACVAECTRLGHPYAEQLCNGQHHYCGAIL